VATAHWVAGGYAANLRAGIRLSARLVARRSDGRVRALRARRDRAAAARPGVGQRHAAHRQQCREPGAALVADGSRIAFVSSVYNGRWHIFVLSPEGARDPLVSPKTTTASSTLLLQQVDHYISPAWSPDGKEIILVSDRGHIHGNRRVVRMEARPAERCASSVMRRRRGRRGPTGHLTGRASFLQLLPRQAVESAVADDERRAAILSGCTYGGSTATARAGRAMAAASHLSPMKRQHIPVGDRCRRGGESSA